MHPYLHMIWRQDIQTDSVLCLEWSKYFNMLRTCWGTGCQCILLSLLSVSFRTCVMEQQTTWGLTVSSPAAGRQNDVPSGWQAWYWCCCFDVCLYFPVCYILMQIVSGAWHWAGWFPWVAATLHHSLKHHSYCVILVSSIYLCKNHIFISQILLLQ